MVFGTDYRYASGSWWPHACSNLEDEGRNDEGPGMMLRDAQIKKVSFIHTFHPCIHFIITYTQNYSNLNHFYKKKKHYFFRLKWISTLNGRKIILILGLQPPKLPRLSRFCNAYEIRDLPTCSLTKKNKLEYFNPKTSNSLRPAPWFERMEVARVISYAEEHCFKLLGISANADQ